MPKINSGPKYIGGPRVKVHVTQGIIDNAIESNSSHCVIADSIKASLSVKSGSRYTAVTVDLSQIRLTDRLLGKRFIYFTPQKCQRAIAQFDQGKRDSLVPFTFGLQTPVQVVPAGAKTGIDTSKERSDASRKGGIATAKLRQKFAQKDTGKSSRQTRAQKQNGKKIPLASPLGNRRQFGMKGLGDLDAPTA
jgi:hypothetical protein